MNEKQPSIEQEKEIAKLELYIKKLRSSGLDDNQINKKLIDQGLEPTIASKLVPTENQLVDRNFNILKVVCDIAIVLAILAIIGGVYLFFNLFSDDLYAAITGLVVGLVGGLSLIVWGNLVKILINIEHNTYKTNEFLGKIINNKK